MHRKFKNRANKQSESAREFSALLITNAFKLVYNKQSLACVNACRCVSFIFRQAVNLECVYGSTLCLNLKTKMSALISVNQCIICLKRKNIKVSSTENGRNKIIEAANIRQDDV